MEYHGPLYGRIGRKHFYTGKTSDDFDKLTSDNKKMKLFLQNKVSDMKRKLKKEFIKTREFTNLSVLIREYDELIKELDD